MFRRLAPKLILALTIIVAIVEAGIGLVNSRTQERQLLGAMITGADQLSRAVTSATWHAMLSDHREAAYQIMRTIADKQGIDRIRIFNKAGRIMFSTNAEERNRQVDKRAESCSLCHASLQPLVKVDVPSRARVFRDSAGRRHLAIITPIYNEPACSNAVCHAHPTATNVLGVVDVLLNLDEVDRELAKMRLRRLEASVVHILIMSAFILLFTRRFLALPLRRLIAAIKSVGEMDLDKPIELGGSEELEQVARPFNAMRERLKAAVEENSQLTQRLESKVRERTEQLEAAHQRLLQAARLASLGRVAASVAHEVNNPLSTVLTLSTLMQRILIEDGIPPERLAEFRRHLSNVVGESARAGRIVSDLLLFSRRAETRRAEADLNALISATAALVAHKFKLAEVALELDLAERLPAVVCDAAQIQQVLVNLLINAVEASPPGRPGRVLVTTRPSGDSIVVSIADSGEGIAEEHLAHLFEPFFTTKPEGKGVGLGLAVSYGIIQAHGGEIGVESTPGRGSIFTVRLPLQPPQESREDRNAEIELQDSRRG